MSAFEAFPKITRFTNVECVITEKIDGTNAALVFDESGALTCQSRKRNITPDDDNYGFARWAHDRSDDLFRFFGEGRHFGEWWGSGVQRGYGVSTKLFTPFNVGRFNTEIAPDEWPEQCVPLPILATCPLAELADTLASVEAEMLRGGSVIADGFPNPEGVMIWSRSTGYIKHPFDPAPKGLAA